MKDTLSETELPLCSLVGSVLYFRCFLTGVLTTSNLSVDSLTQYRLGIVLNALHQVTVVYAGKTGKPGCGKQLLVKSL